MLTQREHEGVTDCLFVQGLDGIFQVWCHIAADPRKGHSTSWCRQTGLQSPTLPSRRNYCLSVAETSQSLAALCLPSGFAFLGRLHARKSERSACAQPTSALGRLGLWAPKLRCPTEQKTPKGRPLRRSGTLQLGSCWHSFLILAMKGDVRFALTPD